MRPILSRGAFVLALCLVPFCADLDAGQKPAAGRVESISPSSARPGEPIKVTGRGFGAKNARVTVGTHPAAIVSATGNAIVFTVPRQASPGPTLVTVTNPGGQGGAIAFTVLGTGPQVGGQDDARARSAVVSGDGGVIATTSEGGVIFSLDVPPGAVATDTLITLTPVTSLVGLPLSGTSHFAVRMQPAGLQFDRPATLTIALPEGTDASRLFGFVFDDDGGNFEVLPARIDGTSFALPIAHFTTAGLGEGTLGDFEREIAPLLNALPNTLPPTQVTPLLNQMNEWLRRFGPDVCTQTALCAQLFDTATQSLTFHRDQACSQAIAFAQQGEPFPARTALAAVVRLTASIVATSADASSLGLIGFDQTVNLDCLSTALVAAIDTARQQALDNPRAGLLLLLLDLTADAAITGLDDAEAHGRAVLAEVLDALLASGQARCESDADAGELLLELVRNTFEGLTLDQISPDLATRYYEAWAGCRIRLTPPGETVTRGRQVQFSATTSGLPPGFSWSLEVPTGNGAIDAQSGLYTAGRLDGTFTIVATSTASPSRFKRTTVRVVQITVGVSPAAPVVETGDTVQFTAAVTNTSNTNVRWSATGGTIDQAGRFTAASQPGTFFVRATSLEDELEFAEAYVTVRDSGITLSGRLSWVLELSGGLSSQRSELAADVAFQNGVFTAAGGFSFVETAQFECGERIWRTAGVVTGAAITGGSPGASFSLGFTLVGTRTETFCGVVVQEQPIVTNGGGGMYGTALVENGRIVEIDFTFAETYNFPGYTGFYTQTGRLTRR